MRLTTVSKRYLIRGSSLSANSVTTHHLNCLEYNCILHMMACNSTLDNMPDSSWSYALGAIMCVITATATLENLTVLIVIWKYSALHSPSNRILAALAMADFLTGATVAPLHAAQYLNEDIRGNCSVEEVRRYLSTALIGASTFCLGFISFDRCLHLIKLQRYSMKKKVLYPVLVMCWLIPILLPFLRKISNTEEVYSATLVTIGTVVLVIIVGSYIGLLFALRRYTQSCKGSVQASSMENERHAGITVFIIITLYLLMLIPIFVHHGLNSTKSFDKYYLAKTYNIGMLLAVANSSVNPLLYCYRTPALNKCTRQLFAVFWKKGRSQGVGRSSFEQGTIESRT